MFVIVNLRHEEKQMKCFKFSKRAVDTINSSFKLLTEI